MQENKTQMDQGTKLLILGFAGMLVAYFVAKGAGFYMKSIGVDDTISTLMVTIIRSIVAVVIFVALGGGSWIRPSWKSVRETWSFAFGLIIINLIMGVSIAASVLLGVMEETIAFQTFIQMGAYATILCLLVGINEEVMFRGLVLGGLLAKMGGTKDGILKAAIISSVIFGAWHVIFDMNYSNIYSIGSGIMKTVETALFAFILCVPIIRGKNLWGAILAHALFDWILLCGNTIQNGGMTTPAYAFENPAIAMAAIGIFTLMTVLYLPFAIRAYKKLKEVEAPQFGPFVKEGQPAEELEEQPA